MPFSVSVNSILVVYGEQKQKDNDIIRANSNTPTITSMNPQLYSINESGGHFHFWYSFRYLLTSTEYTLPAYKLPPMTLMNWFPIPIFTVSKTASLLVEFSTGAYFKRVYSSG
jgi:hypothetical protein